MNIKRLLCLASALALGAAAIGQAQSLTELARMERERRAKLRKSTGAAKLYTEGDKTGAAVGTDGATILVATTTTTTTTTTAPGGKKDKSPEEQAADRQKEWTERVKKAQDEIKSVEDAIGKNERSLASMYNITPARQDLVNAIDADKKRVAALKQSLVDLEEERRRAGMPRPR